MKEMKVAKVKEVKLMKMSEMRVVKMKGMKVAKVKEVKLMKMSEMKVVKMKGVKMVKMKEVGMKKERNRKRRGRGALLSPWIRGWWESLLTDRPSDRECPVECASKQKMDLEKWIWKWWTWEEMICEKWM